MSLGTHMAIYVHYHAYVNSSFMVWGNAAMMPHRVFTGVIGGQGEFGTAERFKMPLKRLGRLRQVGLDIITIDAPIFPMCQLPQAFCAAGAGLERVIVGFPLYHGREQAWIEPVCIRRMKERFCDALGAGQRNRMFAATGFPDDVAGIHRNPLNAPARGQQRAYRTSGTLAG